MSDEKKNDDDSSVWTSLGIYGALGFQLAFAVVGGLWLGNWCDSKWGTTPILAIVGLMLGFAGGLVNLVRVLNWRNEKKNR